MLFDGLDMFVYGSVLPHMLGQKALGITPDKAGDLGSYATIGMLVGALTAGTVADRIGRKKLMVACVALFSLASALCATAPSLAVFGLGRTPAGDAAVLGGILRGSAARLRSSSASPPCARPGGRRPPVCRGN